MKREPDIDFLTVKPAYFALTIPPEALLARAVCFARASSGTDGGETMGDLIHSLAQADDFNLADVWLLDPTGRELALGLLHHSLISNRLTPDALAQASLEVQRSKEGVRPWRF